YPFRPRPVHRSCRRPCAETRFCSCCPSPYRRRMQMIALRDQRSGDQMGTNNPSKAFGRIFAAREDWLAQAEPEEILEPALAIIDSHHHLWEAPGHYLLEDYLADVGTGHNVVATVVIECGAYQRTKGPVEFRPVGEVEFAASVAARCESDPDIKTRVAAGIVG